MTHQSLGRVWIDDPDENTGDVWSRPYLPDTGQARRGLGRYMLRRRWHSRIRGKVPMATIYVTFDDGQKGWGHMRRDQPGYLHVFKRSHGDAKTT